MLFSIRNIVVYLLNLFLGVVVFFLGFRILLELFGANPSTPFVAWIYNISESFMSPFIGIFPNLNLGGDAVFDVVALLSLIAYAVITHLAIAVVDTVARATGTNVVERHTHI